MPNPANPESIPDFIGVQLSSGSRLRFCFDEPLMSSDAELLLLARHAQQSGDIAYIAAALVPKLRAPGPDQRKLRAPEHSTVELITQRVIQMIGGYPDGNHSNLLRHDPVLKCSWARPHPARPRQCSPASPL